jgi:hypothetical protein
MSTLFLAYLTNARQQVRFTFEADYLAARRSQTGFWPLL